MRYLSILLLLISGVVYAETPNINKPQIANTFLAGPTTGANAIPAFRAITAADIQAAGAGILSINSLTSSSQSLVTGTSGTDFTISSVTATHTFNLPIASASNTGKLSSTDWSIFNGKQSTDATLTALAAYNINGLLTQTAADTFTGRTITGTTDVVTVTNGDGVSGNPTLTIASSYLGQSSITTLGTITTGVWNGTAVGTIYGGTGLTSYSTGQIIYASSTNTLSKLTGNHAADKRFLMQDGNGISTPNAPSWVDGYSVMDLLRLYPGDTGAGSASGIVPSCAIGDAAAGKFLKASGSWAVVDLATITGVLPIANGGTAKALTVSNGGIVYTDADSFEILAATASANRVLVSGASSAPTWSTPKFPVSSATAGKLIQSDGTDWIASGYTYPATVGTSGKVLISNGTNIVSSTSTFSDAPSTALKWLRSDGTNWITSTSTLSDSPSTAGKIPVSDGTNWITSTPTFPNASATSGKFIRSDGTNWITSTPTLPTTAGTSGNLWISDGTNLTSVAVSGAITIDNTGATTRRKTWCRIKRTGNQAVSSGVLTVTLFDGEDNDTDSMHSTVSNTGRITFNTTGIYLVGGSIVSDGNVVQECYIRVNGTTLIASERVGNGNPQSVSLSAVYSFTATDYVEFMSTLGGNVNLTSATSAFAYRVD